MISFCTEHNRKGILRRIIVSNSHDNLVWFGLVWFYGISTIVVYLMLNPAYTCILNIYMICKHIL